MTPAEIDRLIHELEPKAEAAYLDEIQATAQAVNISALETAIDQGDEDALALAIAAVAGYMAMTEIFRQAFIRAGTAEFARALATELAALQQRNATLSAVLRPPPWTPPAGTPPFVPPAGPGSPVVQPGSGPFQPRPPARPIFDPRLPALAQRLGEIDTALVQQTAAAQVEAAAETIAAGQRAGRTTREIAQDVAGRVGRSGQRTGGVLGLGSGEARYVALAREQLASGDKSMLRAYLRRTRRDRRFDATVKKAIATGKELTPEQVNRITGAYADRLKTVRAKMLAQSELINRVNMGREASIRQLAESGMVSLDRITKEWETQGDEKVRHSHAEMDGQSVPFDQPFMSPSGALMMFPGDQSLGAGWDETANCRCGVRFHL